MIKIFRFKLSPNEYQLKKLKSVFKASRIIYNITLDCVRKDYNSNDKYRKVSFYQNLINEIKEVDEYKWIEGINTHLLNKSVSSAYNKFKKFINEGKEEPKYISEDTEPQVIQLDCSTVGIVYNKAHTTMFGSIYKEGIDTIPHYQMTKILVIYDREEYYMEVTMDDSLSEKKVHKSKLSEEYGMAIEFTTDRYMIMLDSNNKLFGAEALNKNPKIEKLENEVSILKKSIENGNDTIENQNKLGVLEKDLDKEKCLEIEDIIDHIIAGEPKFIIMNNYLGSNKFITNDKKMYELAIENKWDYFYSYIIKKCRENNIEFRFTHNIQRTFVRCCKCKYKTESVNFSDEKFICPKCKTSRMRVINTLSNMFSTKKYTVIK